MKTDMIPLGIQPYRWKSDCIFILNRIIQLWCRDCYHFICQVRWLPPPQKGAPAADRWLKIQKNSISVLSRGGPDAGVLLVEDGFHGLGVNWIDSCLFLQSNISFRICPTPERIARPSLLGFAGQGGFFKNHAHKTALKSPRGRPFVGRRRSSYSGVRVHQPPCL